jgi:hypothetical protein
MATTNTPPRGVSLARRRDGVTVITHYTPNIVELKFAALAFWAIFLVGFSVVVGKQWFIQERVDGFLAGLLGLPIVLVCYLAIVAVLNMLWFLRWATHLSYRSASMTGLKIFTQYIGWAGDSFFVLAKAWLDLDSVAAFWLSIGGLFVVVLVVVFVIACVSAWHLCKRTQFTLARDALEIEERLGWVSDCWKCEKSIIKQFTLECVVTGENGAPVVGDSMYFSRNFDVKAELRIVSVEVLSGQGPAVAEWFCLVLNDWLGNTKRPQLALAAFMRAAANAQ